ncbi:gastrin/cholecystokinin type B receptor [Astyanax mexicanus]|uniref:gastrin/cholecystokinin type B receptor n=1 Tax=Astyanax mexicanus TaxID=7994 RepID=UPI0020CB386F|nr:gastrin/cholecystokinin type B receptor [Astyanax mexicanus]
MNFSSLFATSGPPGLSNSSLRTPSSHNSSASVPAHPPLPPSPLPPPPHPHLPPMDVLFSGREPGTVLLALMYVASFLTGLAGNVTALLALGGGRKGSRMKVLRMRSASSATRRLLANLAACDTLVVCVCMPANLGHHVHRAWPFGEPLCRAVPFVQAVSVSASVLSLAALGLSRYCGVHSPLRARHAFTGARVGVVIAAVWAVSSGLCLPLLFTNETRTLELPDGARSVTLCVESWSEARLRQGYNFLLFCALYAFPVLFNLVICSLTVRKLWGAKHEAAEFGFTRSGSRLETRKRIAKMVLVLVLLFTFSWLPLYVVDIWLDFHMPADRGGVPERVEHEWVLQGRPFAQWLGLTNSALNPLCYCFVGELRRSARRLAASYRLRVSGLFRKTKDSKSSKAPERECV